MIIAISGLTIDEAGNKGSAGAGKSTVCNRLVEKHSFVEVAFADPMKRFLREVLDFSEMQLWGPSNSRNEPDARYLRPTKIVYPHTPVGAVWVPLSRTGYYTLIDAEDYDLVSSYKWRLNEKPGRKTDYVQGEVDGQTVKLHQLLIPDVDQGCVIDHINGDGLDNRRTNLRVCTQAENHSNEYKRAGGTSAFKGVSFDSSRGKWSAKIFVSGETRNLGRFDREIDAAVAYDKAAREAFGVYARVNSDMFLTPRHALQTLGTDWARRMCWPDIWVAYAMRIAKEILTNRIKYDHVEGATDGTNSLRGAEPPRGVVFSDMRFKNEFDYIKKNGGKVIRVVRPVPLLEVSSGHQSENDLNDVPDSEFDHVIYGQPNDTHDLCLQADRMVDWMRGRIRAYDAEAENVPPFLRGATEQDAGPSPCCSLDTDGDGDCPVHRR